MKKTNKIYGGSKPCCGNCKHCHLVVESDIGNGYFHYYCEVKEGRVKNNELCEDYKRKEE